MPEFSDLNAVFINCSLKKDRTDSHTGKLLAHAAAVMKHNGVSIDTIYALDHQIAFGSPAFVLRSSSACTATVRRPMSMVSMCITARLAGAW
mgnify:CR=1 FL=1